MLKNDTALITGAAGGIGRKIIEIFSQNGANIIACIRKQNKEFEKFCGDLETKYNNQIKIFAIDFNEDESYFKFKYIKKLQKNRYFVNNAGEVTNELYLMMTEKNFREFMRLNFLHNQNNETCN